MHDGTGTATEAQANLYDFTQTEIIIPINVRPGGRALIVKHKLRKPTFAELEARDKKQTAESITKGNEEFIEGAGSGPDLELWDKLALWVHGYGIPDVQATADGWVEVSPVAAKLIPHAHKLAAVRALHESDYELLSSDDEISDVFVLGATESRVRQTIGNYEIVHTLREMSESERVEFEKRSVKASFLRGKGKDIRTRIQPNLKAHVELYDKLFTSVEGATGGKEAIDAIFKRGVVNAVMSAQTAILQD